MMITMLLLMLLLMMMMLITTVDDDSDNSSVQGCVSKVLWWIEDNQTSITVFLVSIVVVQVWCCSTTSDCII